MSNSTAMSTNMTPWLHFGNMDYLIFKAWCPSSHGAIIGACIGLFLFCTLERCLAAFRRTQELRWEASEGHSSEEYGSLGSDGLHPTRRQLVPAFVPSHDIPRGIIHTFQSILSYTLMLAVMTFNGAYIISIILGLGVGEVLFGRFGRSGKLH